MRRCSHILFTLLPVVVAWRFQSAEAFQFSSNRPLSSSRTVHSAAPIRTRAPRLLRDTKTCALASSSPDVMSLTRIEDNVAQLKKVLEREYVTFFYPMERDYYVDEVTFDDPLNSLAGIDSYENNVNMLAGRTLFGSLLFQDASINLHSIEGGQVLADGSISNIQTRWTLKVCFKILPWKPTARFSGISIYQVQLGGPKGVQILKQKDYWDSINLQPDGSYRAVDHFIGLMDFLNQCKPSDMSAPSAGPELPFELLRRGNGYEVRRYPPFTSVQIHYDRRDDGFSRLNDFTSGMDPLAPAIMQVYQDNSKTMMWPLAYAQPGENEIPNVPKAQEKASELTGASFNIVKRPATVVAVRRFSDASVEPVVRQADAELRVACARDGLVVPATTATTSTLTFAQYDAIFSMGKRRGEVWIELCEGSHPWPAR